MKVRHWLIVGMVAALRVNTSLSATLPAAISRESEFVSERLEALSVGINFDRIARRIDLDDSDAAETGKAEAWAVYLGYDQLPWFTFFLTLGGSEAKASATGDYLDSRLKWSLGMNLNLWQMDIDDPGFAAGRITIKPMAEFARYTSGEDNDEVRWTDFVVALPLGYEKFAPDPQFGRKEVHSLALYIGPAFSLVSGTSRTGGYSVDFSGDETFGAVAGGDLYLSPNLSIGCYLQSFGEKTVSGNFRYHF